MTNKKTETITKRRKGEAMARMGLKSKRKNKSGLSVEFRDALGNEFTLEDFIESPSLRSMYNVHLRTKNNVTYLASDPDGKKKNNL